MRYGYFADDRREYVITRPDTPVPWINYLGTDGYFGTVSNTAGGFSWAPGRLPVLVTFNMSRPVSSYETGISRGTGFRDSRQDLLGAVQLVPERSRERILDLAAAQFASGGAFHQYQPPPRPAAPRSSTRPSSSATRGRPDHREPAGRHR